MQIITSTDTPAPQQAAPLHDDDYLSAAETRRRIFGGISEPTEFRWSKRFSDFPTPIRVGLRKFYKVGEARAFMARRSGPADARA